MNCCKNCNEETKNPQFCCHSCAATFNNVKERFPKRYKRVYYCVYCGEIAKHQRKIDGVYRMLCSDCFAPRLLSNEEQGDLTLNKLKHLSIHQRHAKIRGYSRSVYTRSNKPQACYSCGYDKHIEVCHIKPIASFDGDTPFRIINSVDNLVALCRNCHWEFDHKLLEIDFILDIK